MQDPKTFVIGDVHGCALSLQRLLASMKPRAGDSFCFLGDYIDRGPDSKGVVDTILSLREEGYFVVTLRGNHEQLFIDTDKGGQHLKLWKSNGGVAAMASFGIERFCDLEEPYRQFFLDTQFYYELPGYVLVHAGLNFSEPDPFSDRNAMLWLREYTVQKERIGGRTIIHGHTPTPFHKILAQKGKEGRINLDGGCVYGPREGLGYLVAMEVTRGEFIYQKCVDRL